MLYFHQLIDELDKETTELIYNVDRMNLIDIYRTLLARVKDYILFFISVYKYL